MTIRDKKLINIGSSQPKKKITKVRTETQKIFFNDDKVGSLTVI